MRFLIVAGVAALLLLPATAPAQACGTGLQAQAATADFSAAKKKAVKKVAKKHKKKKAPKVEYMRAVPMK